MDRDYIQDVPGLPGKAGSIWLDREAPSYPAISEDREFDVVVVGAGIVGALTAMHLAETGASVALIERGRVGAGATGHSTAKITAQHAVAWGRLLELHGAERLREYAAQNARAASELSAIARDRGIECGLAQMPCYLYASDPQAAERLAQEADAYRQLALPGGLEPAPALPFEVHGSVLAMRDQAVFDAAAFVTGLVHDLEQRVTIAENMPVRSAEETEHGVVLHCDGATVRATSLVTATHAPLLDTAALFSRLYTYRSYALAFETKASIPAASWIPAERDAGLTLRPVGDGSDGRWIGSGVHHKAGQGGDERECYLQLAGLVREFFPDAEFLYHWSTQDGMTADGLPFIGRLPSTHRVFLATGFAAWGMTKAVVAARLLADLVAGRSSALQELLDPGRVEPLKDLREFVSENVNVGGRALRGFLSRTDRAADTSALEVRHEGGRREAVRHDPDGSEQVHNARCTHMGCVVEVNEAELTWDCPCHGSRYDSDASVIEGPARENLHASTE